MESKETTTTHTLAKKIADRWYFKGDNPSWIGAFKEICDQEIRKWLGDKIYNFHVVPALSHKTLREYFELDEPEKKWCSHIQVSGGHNQSTWIFHPIKNYDVHDQVKEAGLDWDYCPICGTKRP